MHRARPLIDVVKPTDAVKRIDAVERPSLCSGVTGETCPRRPLATRAAWGGPLTVGLALAVLGCEPSADADQLSVAATAPRSSATVQSEPAASADAIEPPRVALDGAPEHLSEGIVERGPRVYSRHLRAWIFEKPSRDAPRLGYLRAGASSPTSEKPAGHSGCKQGWHPVQPRGYVCIGRRATLDGSDPIVKATETLRPRFDTKLPYRYGTVRKPGPVYQRLPTLDEMSKAEPGLFDRMQEWFKAGGEIGASYAQHVWEWGEEAPDPEASWIAKRTAGVPDFLQDHAIAPSVTLAHRPTTMTMDRMLPKVGYAFVESFFYEGRRWGLSTHLELLPTDRLRPIQGSDFHGVEIGKDVEFPFAFVRRPDARYRNGKVAEYRAVLPLTGKQQFFDGVLHYETKDGHYISDRHASRLDPAKKMPGWAKEGERWIDISLLKQTLVLYEGTKPVYATLISSGEAGLASHEDTTATRRGIFRIHTKHITATMASDELGEEFELRDVPYVQYFDKTGYAIHGAYWHDRFGTPKSHGCINLAPEDARRVFHWTEPRVPTGWHGALLPLRGTVVFIHP